MAGFYGRAGVELKDTLSGGIQSLKPRVRKIIEAACLNGGEMIRAQAYLNANVSPGVKGHGVNGEHMRDEIRVELMERPNDISARVGVDMSIIPYAAHQEFGDRGNAYLSRAIDEMRQAVHAVVRDTIAAGLKNKHVELSTLVRFRRIA